MAMNVALQAVAPVRSAAINFGSRILVSAAIGAAMVLKPGTNFANSRDTAPSLPNVRLVLLTQESGSREMRHSRLRMEWPRVFPREYQIKSLIRAAATARLMDTHTEK